MNPHICFLWMFFDVCTNFLIKIANYLNIIFTFAMSNSENQYYFQ